MKRKTPVIKIKKYSEIQDIELITGTDINNLFPVHVHKTLIIGIVTQGIRLIKLEDKSIEIGKNQIFLLNPNQAHACSSKNNYHSYKILSINHELIHIIIAQIHNTKKGTPFFKQNKIDNKEISSKFIKIFDLTEKKRPSQKIKTEIYSFLKSLIKTYYEPKFTVNNHLEENFWINSCESIEKYFINSIPLKELAEKSYMSKFHFQRKFKKIKGISPREFQRSLRISKSIELLLKTQNISETAVSVGFYDQSHFTKEFKRSMGIPPGKFIKINKN